MDFVLRFELVSGSPPAVAERVWMRARVPRSGSLPPSSRAEVKALAGLHDAGELRAESRQQRPALTGSQRPAATCTRFASQVARPAIV